MNKINKKVVKLLFMITLILSLTAGLKRAHTYLLQRYYYNYDPEANSLYTVTVINNTDKIISGLSITFGESDEKIVEVPIIKPKSAEVCKVATIKSETQTNTMWAAYSDNNEEIHKTNITDYFQKGLGGKKRLIINEIDTNGILNLSVEKDGIFK